MKFLNESTRLLDRVQDKSNSVPQLKARINKDLTNSFSYLLAYCELVFKEIVYVRVHVTSLENEATSNFSNRQRMTHSSIQKMSNVFRKIERACSRSSARFVTKLVDTKKNMKEAAKSEMEKRKI